LAAEIRALGYEPIDVFPAGVAIEGSMIDCIRLCLHLRSASQVLYELRRFDCRHPDELYRRLVGIPWEEFIADDGYFTVTTNVQHPSIRNSMFAGMRVKDAIVDRIRRTKGGRPDAGAEAEGAVVHLYWHDESAVVYLDAAGHTLARHGYRKQPWKAPLGEALAAALIMTSRWDTKTAFINPMCGSGTLAIEAALIAMNRKPGYYRYHYGYRFLLGYSSAYDEAERKIMELAEDTSRMPEIIATDISRDAIRAARANAQMAGVEEFIHFAVGDFRRTPIPETEKGVVMLNPEYGERLGEIEQLEVLYPAIGDFFKQQCQGYTGYVFTGNLPLGKTIGLKTSKKQSFYNGKLDCQLLEFPLFRGTAKDHKAEGASEGAESAADTGTEPAADE
jgi:putative N6-adenine-specific DNA methylase